MKKGNTYLTFLVIVAIAVLIYSCSTKKVNIPVFDVHLHGDPAPLKQLSQLKTSNVYKIALSTSWPLQNTYSSDDKLKVLHGLMVPCPNGKVPYSLQPCFADGKEWPDVNWVEQQIKEGRINFLGEVLTQYHGISSSDSLMFPYYALAEKYRLPVGIHTGSAGPDHGSPNFKEEMGNPTLMKNALLRFPTLKVWLMHGGAPFVKEFIGMMKAHPGLYADISVLNNSRIIPAADFAGMMKKFIDAGFEDRLMFGSDNADIQATITAIDTLTFLSVEQKEKIFYKNAETFFAN